MNGPIQRINPITSVPTNVVKRDTEKHTDFIEYFSFSKGQLYQIGTKSLSTLFDQLEDPERARITFYGRMSCQTTSPSSVAQFYSLRKLDFSITKNHMVSKLFLTRTATVSL